MATSIDMPSFQAIANMVVNGNLAPRGSSWVAENAP